MIQTVTLINVQAHKNLTLHFDPGVNILRGETDAGKSAVIRSLNLALNNQPRGGEKIYLHNGADEPLEIIVHDFHGNIIHRKNRSYIINDRPALTGFKQDKPEAVARIIRTSGVNFQLQIQPHYLILETGGNAAKILNSVTGMEDQMLLLAEVKSRKDATRRQYLELMAEKESLSKKIMELATVPIFIKRLYSIIDHQEALTVTQSLIDKLSSYLSIAYKSIKKQQSLRFLDELEIKFAEIFERALSITDTLKSIDRLSTLTLQLSQGQKRLASLQNLDDPDKQATALQEKAIQLKSLENRIDTLSGMIGVIQERQQISFSLEMEIDKAQMEFDDMMAKAGVCPLCGASQEERGLSV